MKDYLRDRNGRIRLHFTVSPDHQSLFQTLAEEIKQEITKHDEEYRVEFSIQKPSTDTIAVDPDNQLFRDDKGDLVFRPGGHGALLQNLNDLDADMVFISNIDNVAPLPLQEERVKYKKLLGAFLLKKVKRIHEILSKIDQHVPSEQLRKEIHTVIEEFSPQSAEEMKDMDNMDFRKSAVKLLNRPVRVCGMVKNEGEPGGGPFWIRDKSGKISKQIIESSQIDSDNLQQKEIFSQSTHFNPVDLACFLKDYKGRSFDLPDFSNPDMGFIAQKSQSGKTLKALELPGLWNGAMAEWITLFVEVPLSTFSPVKTVFDLLRPEHQGITE